MNHPSNTICARSCASQQEEILAVALHRRFGASGQICGLRRCPSAFRSSFALEELDVLLADGTTLRLMFKDLSWEALNENGRRAKPGFLYDPLREIEMYQFVLPHYQLGTAACYGALANSEKGQYWLFLERVPGSELYQIGDFDIWQNVARWLVVMHARLADEVKNSRTTHLLIYGDEFYRLWQRRAVAILGATDLGRAVDTRREFLQLAEKYDRVIARLTSMPVTLLHGEFYASNILVQKTAGPLRVCPIDWEMAAIGPGLFDLAALVAGNWSEEQKIGLATAYHEMSVHLKGDTLPLSDFLTALDYCRLHLAVQRVGWAAEWSPPPEHAQDWLGETMMLADKLGLL